MRVLVVNGTDQSGRVGYCPPLPSGTSELIESNGWELTTVADFGEAMESARTGGIDAVIMSEPAGRGGDRPTYTEFDSFLRFISTQRIAALLVSSRPGAGGVADSRSLVNVVRPDISLGELQGRLAMVDRYHRLVRRLEGELHTMERLSKKLSEHFNEVDQEMQLAGRLQRDFLPNLNEPIANIEFSAIYRPASFVSGDIFDVFRIDEDHTGVYLADAVGHGMAASLLTMFIKRAIVPKRVEGESYTIVEPNEVLAALNDALADEKLPSCQFVTGCYLLIDHRTNTLRYARGGHPYPILISRDGVQSELKSSGGLLGITKGEEFETCELKLQAGDKLILYTDGVELAFTEDGSGPPDTKAFERLICDLKAHPGRSMLRQIEDILDRSADSSATSDDVTIIVFDVLS